MTERGGAGRNLHGEPTKEHSGGRSVRPDGPGRCSRRPSFPTLACPGNEAYPLYWRVRTRYPERFGQPCRIRIRARRMNTVLVEFEDGFWTITSGWYVRRRPTS